MRRSHNVSFIIIVMVLLFFAIHWFRNQNVQRDIGEYALGLRTKDFGCKVNGPYQDKACTPGAVFPQATVDQICVRGYAHSVRDVPYEVKKQAYEEYGVYHRYKGEYEVDHLVSLELGGSNDIANLWPEAADPRPGFHEKDKVENYLHQEVCAGRIPLKKAQWLIADDWMKVYNQL